MNGCSSDARVTPAFLSRVLLGGGFRYPEQLSRTGDVDVRCAVATYGRFVLYPEPQVKGDIDAGLHRPLALWYRRVVVLLFHGIEYIDLSIYSSSRKFDISEGKWLSG